MRPRLFNSSVRSAKSLNTRFAIPVTDTAESGLECEPEKTIYLEWLKIFTPANDYK
jgi:hypothetical protein